MIESRVSAIMLAAGASRRMGGRDKLLLEYEGKTLLQRAVELLDNLHVFERILVTTKARLEKSVVPASIHVVISCFSEEGQSGSLRQGLEMAAGDRYLFLMADQPLLTLAGLQPLLELSEKNIDKIVFPSVRGKPCTPSLFPARFREALMSLTGDMGGRAIRKAYPEACLTFEAENPNDFLDIDSEEEYRSLSQLHWG